MANILRLPTAAAEPVINRKRYGTAAPNVVRVYELQYRRKEREQARQGSDFEAIAKARLAIPPAPRELTPGWITAAADTAASLLSLKGRERLYRRIQQGALELLQDDLERGRRAGE